MALTLNCARVWSVLANSQMEWLWSAEARRCAWRVLCRPPIAIGLGAAWALGAQRAKVEGPMGVDAECRALRGTPRSERPTVIGQQPR